MLFDFTTLSAKDRYKLLVSTIVPRPIAWVVTQDSEGVLNAAPYSFFNAFANEPPIVVIGIGGRTEGDLKDTLVDSADDTGRREELEHRVGGTSDDPTAKHDETSPNVSPRF